MESQTWSAEKLQWAAQLAEMGFEPSKIKIALKNPKTLTLDQAIDFLGDESAESGTVDTVVEGEGDGATSATDGATAATAGATDGATAGATAGGTDGAAVIEKLVVPKLTPEEARMKAQILQEKLKELRDLKAKEDNLAREVARFESGKKMSEALLALEESKRKRDIDEAVREREAAAKEKERQKQLLREEYRDRFGHEPPDDFLTHAAAAKPPKTVVLENLNRLKLKASTDPAGVAGCLNLVKAYLSNIQKDPLKPLYRKIKTTNAAYVNKVAPHAEALTILQTCGFKVVCENGEEFLVNNDTPPNTFLFGETVKFIDTILRTAT